MARVFVSYTHSEPDQTVAASLVAALEQQKFEVFWDPRIEVGMKWAAAIASEIEKCSAFVVLISARSIQSDMVREEIRLAHKNEKAVYPIRLEFDGDLPYDLASYLDPIQYLRWTLATSDKVIGAVVVAIAKNTPPAGAEAVATAASIKQLFDATEGGGLPLPAADPRFMAPETGTVALDSRFYVAREVDRDVLGYLETGAATIILKGPRQSGKSSLLARLLGDARGKGHRAFYLDLQLTNRKFFNSLDQLLLYLAHKLKRELDLSCDPSDYWDEILGAQDSLQDYIEAMLEEADEHTVLLLDEVDRLFEFDFRDEFFSMVRGWHNLRATKEIWNRLTIAIAHSTEPYLWIQNIHQSPFNVGHSHILLDFSESELAWLNERYGRPLASRTEIAALMALVGGHPYLVRRAFHELRTEQLSSLEKNAAEEASPFIDHLRRFAWALRASPDLQNALRQILARGACDSESAFESLRAAGLVRGASRRSVGPRCELYRKYFTRHLP